AATPDAASFEPPAGSHEWPGGEDWTRPVLLRESLTYPPDSVRVQITGAVLVTGTIGIDGKGTDLSVGCSSGFKMLDGATLGSIKRWTYHPAMAGGQPVPSELRALVDYRVEPSWWGF